MNEEDDHFYLNNSERNEKNVRLFGQDLKTINVLRRKNDRRKMARLD